MLITNIFFFEIIENLRSGNVKLGGFFASQPQSQIKSKDNCVFAVIPKIPNWISDFAGHGVFSRSPSQVKVTSNSTLI